MLMVGNDLSCKFWASGRFVHMVTHTLHVEDEGQP